MTTVIKHCLQILEGKSFEPKILHAAKLSLKWEGKTKIHQAFKLLAPFPHILHENFGGSVGKEYTCNAGNLGSIPGLGRSPGEGHGNTLQYSCLENPRRQRSLEGCSRGVTKSQSWMSDKAQNSTFSGKMKREFKKKECVRHEIWWL